MTGINQKVFSRAFSVMLDSHLGDKSDIFHHNNENNQLER